MLDFDLAGLYETEIKSLNLAVKRNKKRFPADLVSCLHVITIVITLRKKQSVMRTSYKNGKKNKPSNVKEPIAVYSSRLRDIGNSKGLILNSRAIEIAGLNAEADIVVQVNEGVITIFQERQGKVNTDLSTWDKQFKSAIKKGAKPDADLFHRLENEFDQ